MSSPVKLGDTITFFPADHIEKTIRWKHNLGNREEKYYAVAAKNRDAHLNLFVQKDRFDNMLNNYATEKGDRIGLEVTTDLQYGEKNKAGERRFLVLHDKEHRPYQSRFVEATLVSLDGPLALQLAENFGYVEAGDTLGVEESLNPLCDF